MKQACIKIPAELFALAESSRFDGSISLPELRIGPDDYRFEEDLTWSVEVTNTGSALLVEGIVEGVGTVDCARCLEDVTHVFKGEIEGYFLTGVESPDEEDEDDEELGADEFDILPDDHIIDMEPLIVAALMIDAPDQPLCSPNCQGLCPTCGANLNDGPCACEGDEELEAFARAANPFSVLADFKFD